MDICIVGINHVSCSLTIREKLIRQLKNNGNFLDFPTVSIITCNRIEIYFSLKKNLFSKEKVLSFFKQKGANPYSYVGKECFFHLIKVAAGLDSVIYFETEIQRQVKQGYLDAVKIRNMPSEIHYLFQKSLKVSKLLRNYSFPIPSLSKVIFEKSISYFPDIKNKRILFVGNSKTNHSIRSFFSKKGLSDFSLHSKKHFTEKNCRYLTNLSSWDLFDIIICATYSDDYLIKPMQVEKSLLVFDLSVPRSVHPEVEKQVTYFHMEQINELIGEMSKRHKVEKKALEQIGYDNMQRLFSIYLEKQTKIPHGQDTLEKESHLLCFPCPSQTG